MNIKTNPSFEIKELNTEKKNLRDIPFDIDALNDGNFKRYLKHLDAISGSPKEYFPLSLLCAISGCAGKYPHFKISENMTIYFNLWGCIVGESTKAKKSTALNLATYDLQRIEHSNNELYKKALKEYEYQKTNQRKQSKGGESQNDKNKTGNFEGFELEKPEPQYLLLPQDFTMESLALILESSVRGLMVHGELGSFLRILERSYSGDAKQTLTHFYDVPESHKITRQTRENVHLHRPYFSLLSASTPEWLNKFTSDSDLSSGFIARFIFAIKEENEKPYIPIMDMGDVTFKSEYYFNVREIFEEICSQNSPFALSIETEARNLHRIKDIAFNNYIMTKEGNITSSLSRLSISSVKFAGLIALFNRRTYITVQDIEDSFLLVDYFAKNAERIFNVLKTKTIFEQKRDKILDVLQRKQRASKTELYQATGFDQRELDSVLATMLQSENIKATSERTDGGKKPKLFYELN